MSRIFFLTNHVCVGESGGGHGVEFRLHQADIKYNLFDCDVIYIFGDRVIEGKAATGDFRETKDQPKKSDFRLGIRKFIPSFFRILKLKKMDEKISAYLKTLDGKYSFCDDDIFIFHDVKIARPFLEHYQFSKTALVYHMQGSIYNEWRADTGFNSKMMQKYYDMMFWEIARGIRYLCFPSRGSEESLVASAPELQDAVDAVEKKYLYNGVFCPPVSKNEFPDWIKELASFDGYIFITVAVLNQSKAVERIPQYISALKKIGQKVKWILIGNGVNAGLVQERISKCGIEEEVIWKKGNVKHSELMQLFSITDFYILFHKYSIFDLSTLEAMHYGNIPVLTPVGGNKEMIIEDNGVFVSDFGDVSGLMQVINDGRLEDLAEKNREIKRRLFDEKAFLHRYVELCDDLTQ